MYGIAVHPTQPMLVTSDSQGRIDQWFVLADCQTPPGFDLTASVCSSLESRVAPSSPSSQPTPKPRIREILTPVAPHTPADA